MSFASQKHDTPERIVSHANTVKPWIWSSSVATNGNANGFFYDGRNEKHWAILHNNWYQRPVLYLSNI